MRSVKNWLTLVLLALVAVASLTSWLYVVPSLQQRLVAQRLSEIKRNTGKIGNTVGAWLNIENGALVVKDYAALSKAANLLDTIYSARVVVVNPNTKKTATVVDTREGAKFAIDDYPMYTAAITRVKTVQGTVSIGGRRFAVTALPITVPGAGPTLYQTSAVIMIIASLHDVNSAVTLVRTRVLLATALAILVSLVAGYCSRPSVACSRPRCTT